MRSSRKIQIGALMLFPAPYMIREANDPFITRKADDLHECTSKRIRAANRPLSFLRRFRRPITFYAKALKKANALIQNSQAICPFSHEVSLFFFFDMHRIIFAIFALQHSLTEQTILYAP